MYKNFIGYAKEPEKQKQNMLLSISGTIIHGINFAMHLKIIIQCLTVKENGRIFVRQKNLIILKTP